MSFSKLNIFLSDNYNETMFCRSRRCVAVRLFKAHSYINQNLTALHLLKKNGMILNIHYTHYQHTVFVNEVQS